MAEFATQLRDFADDTDVQDFAPHDPRFAAPSPVASGPDALPDVRPDQRDSRALRFGVYYLRPGTPDSVVRDVVRDRAFDTLFLDAGDWGTDASLVGRAKQARDIVGEAGVRRFRPVIVSVGSVPEENLGRVVKLLARNDIPVTSAPFARYAVPPVR